MSLNYEIRNKWHKFMILHMPESMLAWTIWSQKILNKIKIHIQLQIQYYKHLDQGLGGEDFSGVDSKTKWHRQEPKSPGPRQIVQNYVIVGSLLGARISFRFLCRRWAVMSNKEIMFFIILFSCHNFTTICEQVWLDCAPSNQTCVS